MNSLTEDTEYILNEFLEYELDGEKCSNTENKNVLFQHHQIQLFKKQNKNKLAYRNILRTA